MLVSWCVMLQFALLHTVLFSSNLSIQVNRELIFPEVSSLFFYFFFFRYCLVKSNFAMLSSVWFEPCSIPSVFMKVSLDCWPCQLIDLPPREDSDVVKLFFFILFFYLNHQTLSSPACAGLSFWMTCLTVDSASSKLFAISLMCWFWFVSLMMFTFNDQLPIKFSTWNK